MSEELMILDGALQERPEQALEASDYERFLKFEQVKEKSALTYRRALKQLYEYLESRGKAARPEREDILDFKEELIASGHSAATIQLYMTAAKLFFRWLSEEGLYRNIADHIKLRDVKIDKGFKKDYFTAGEVQAILAGIDTTTLKGKRDYAMLALMVTCGLRTIEVARASVEDLRPRGNSAVLYVQGKGRTDKKDFVKVSPAVEACIREYLTARGKAAGDAPLFASVSNHDQGGRMDAMSVSRIAKTAFRAAGYDSSRWTAHSLRHTAVTLSLLAGKEITEVQEFARHSNINTTLIYDHALQGERNTCSQAVADAIF